MEYFRNLSQSFQIQSFSERRLRQLEKEKELDYTLLLAYRHCPVTVLQYFLKSRELNRRYSEDLYGSSLFSYPEKVGRMLDTSDLLYKTYYTTCPRQICVNLERLVEDINTRLEKSNTV